MPGYDVGDTRTFEQRTFDQDGVLTAPGALTLTVTNPAESTTTYSLAGATITADGTGEYHRDVLLNLAGVWRWTWTVTGVEVESGAIMVGGPRDATPWVGAEDVFSCKPCATIADGDRNYAEAALCALAATEMLYLLTGRLYPGIAQITTRPCRRSALWDQGWLNARGSFWGYGGCSCGAHSPAGCACSRLRAVALGADVLDIHSVLIDGAAFTDYRLDENRFLVRTDGEGWPSAQDLHLDATEPGTWSVAYSAGRSAPVMGVLAARRLACELYQACGGGGECQLPPNIQSLASQGEVIAFADPADLMGPDGKTGIWAVDQFLNAERYGDEHLGTLTVSPDTGPRSWKAGV